jgi:hypothetical protein
MQDDAKRSGSRKKGKFDKISNSKGQGIYGKRTYKLSFEILTQQKENLVQV